SAEAVPEEPGDGTIEPFGERDCRLEPERRPGALDVEPAARLSVGLPRIEADLAGEPDAVGDGPRELGDRDLGPGPDVDGLRDLQALGRETDRPRPVLDVEELPGRGARSPDVDHALAAPLCLDELPDERGDDVRARGIVGVAGPVEVDEEKVHPVEP